MEKIRNASLLILIVSSQPNVAQQDRAGTKDHRLVSRYEGFHITHQEIHEFQPYPLFTDVELNDRNDTYTLEKTEGRLTMTEYLDGSKNISPYQVYKNYVSSLEKKGYEIRFKCYKAECDLNGDGVPFFSEHGNGKIQVPDKDIDFYKEPFYILGRGMQDGKRIDVVIAGGHSSKGAGYLIHVVEGEELDLSKVTLKDIDDTLAREGKMAFYGILFDTDKAAIKSESAPTLRTIAQYMKANPNRSFYIVGHTDASGDFDHNLKLSGLRAAAVVGELFSKHGISKKRLSAHGVGMLSPVSTNGNEEGKKRNRRVEFVLK